MKEFLSIERFKELKIVFILEIIMLLLISLLISINSIDININFFDWKPFIISLGIWIVSSFLDKEKYFNLATVICTGFHTYTIFWLIFNI